MSLNITLLSELVQWAAEEHLKRTDHNAAVTLGLVRPDAVPMNARKTENGTWQQGSWAEASRNGICQTSFCIAGHAVAKDKNLLFIMDPLSGSEDGVTRHYQAGRVLHVNDLPEVIPQSVEAVQDLGMLFLDKDIWRLQDETREGAEFCAHLNDRAVTVRDAGQQILGLNDEEARNLFGGGNDIETVVTVASAIAKAHGETLDLPEWVVTMHLDESLVDYYSAAYA